MKNFIFLVVALVAFSPSIQATLQNNVGFENRINPNQPIEFNERGILFFVFPNGEFDFNTRPNDSQGDYYFRGANRRVASPNRLPVNYGVLIENDRFGRIRRVGNTFINYDFNNRVTRIGSVFMRYNRFALAQIGGMQLIYNRFGELVDAYGSVKSFGNRAGFVNPNFGPRGNCNVGYNVNYNSNFNDNGTFNADFNDDFNDGFDRDEPDFSSQNSDYYFKNNRTKNTVSNSEKELRTTSENPGRR